MPILDPIHLNVLQQKVHAETTLPHESSHQEL
jgi:hypothetical protein